MLEIYYSSKFLRMYKKLSPGVKIFAEEQENIFRTNPHDFRLKTHKLAGKLKNYWAFSIGRGYRIIFSFIEKIAFISML